MPKIGENGPLCRMVVWRRMLMASEIIFVIEESPEGGFEAQAVGHSVFTEADTLEELKTKIQDAVRCHFDSVDRPPLIRLHQVRDEVIAA